MKLTEFRDAIANIPSENIICTHFTDYQNSCCVLGHYGRLISENPSDYSYGNVRNKRYKMEDFRKLSHDFMIRKFDLGNDCILHEHNIAMVNNGDSIYYQHPTAKERSLALLDDMIADGFDVM